jgi:[ribosomal protein S18]-alanine N-acetyltransferase
VSRIALHDGPPRLATFADLPAIATLDAACFGNPWSREVYHEELERPFARVRLLEAGAELVGLSCAWMVAGEAHLLRIATLAQARRRGLGRRLLRAVIDEAAASGCREVLLEVGAGNAPAVGLYASFGFQPIGRRKGYYAHPPDDAVVLRLALAAVDLRDPDS